MKIAVDLDGVVYEWQRTYRYMMREYRGIDVGKQEAWDCWDYPDQFTSKEDRKWMWSEGVKLGLFRYGHMTTGSRVGLQALADRGHKFIIATSRPENAVTDTIDWVQLYFKDLPLVGISVLSNGEAKSQVNASVLIDDKPENIVEWVETGRQALLFDQPWNWSTGPIGGARRCRGWREIVECLS